MKQRALRVRLSPVRCLSMRCTRVPAAGRGRRERGEEFHVLVWQSWEKQLIPMCWTWVSVLSNYCRCNEHPFRRFWVTHAPCSQFGADRPVCSRMISLLLFDALPPRRSGVIPRLGTSPIFPNDAHWPRVLTDGTDACMNMSTFEGYHQDWEYLPFQPRP